MARPTMPRIYYTAEDVSLHIDEESMKLIQTQAKKLKMSRWKLAKESGVTYDVIRHLFDYRHIRYSQFLKILSTLELKRKVLLEQKGIEVREKTKDENGKTVIVRKTIPVDG